MRHLSSRSSIPARSTASTRADSAGEALYTLHLFAASGAAAGVQRLSAGSDEEAISDAIGRLRDEAAVEVWRGDEWLCRWERAMARQAVGRA